ncbi:MAG: glycosyltransferase family 9 protein [Candidatus Fermentibacteraceae bacterium]
MRTPNWLGDCVMALESIAGILKKHGGTALWCHPRVMGLFAFFFPETALIPLGARVPRFKRLLLMTSSFRSAYLGALTGIPERTGYSRGVGSVFLTDVIPFHDDRSRHHSLAYETLAMAVGCAPVPITRPIPAPEEHLAVFAGARYGSAKRWNGFPEAVNLLGMPSVFYGTGEEKAELARMANLCGGRCETGLSLPDLAHRLLTARACVGNDSGGVHLAAVLSVPTVAVFCSTSPFWTGPRGSRTGSVVTRAGCSPCFRRKCGSKNWSCTRDITPFDVAEAVRDV